MKNKLFLCIYIIFSFISCTNIKEIKKDSETSNVLIGPNISAIKSLGWENYKDIQYTELSARLLRDNAMIVNNPDFLSINLPTNSIFQFNKDTFMSGAPTIIENIAKILVKYPETKVEIAIHEANLGADSETIISQRLDRLKLFFQQKGVASNRITLKNAGSADPIADNSTSKGREINRRITIKIYSNK